MSGSVHVWLTFHPPSLSTRQGRRFVGIGDLLGGQVGDSGSLDLAGPVALGLCVVEECLSRGAAGGKKQPKQAGCVPACQVRYARALIATVLPIGQYSKYFFFCGINSGSIHHKRRNRIVDVPRLSTVTIG